ncbi:hypothetical protein M436DRAFT_35290 [Aureobasidium namibiae CBS 147.97]|uniref:Uncharacterized protein n=1 Tax=Aureobasidium namibiae CBS 147.97 TaxID=1043004 RepID=A0A074X5Z3_9PEZI
MTPKSLVFLSTLSLASAQAFDRGVYGLGYWNETYAVAANQNPNNTKSVPFQIGTQNYTFQVNVAEFIPTGSQANRTQDPRQAASFYNLLWSGEETLNETLRNAVTPDAGVITPQLCVTIPMGTAPRSATNNYREEDNGDCLHALGKQCMAALKNIGPTIISQCNGLWMPESCSSKLGSGLGSTKILSAASNRTDEVFTMSPVEFASYRSQIFSAGNESYYEREDQRLHVAFLSGSWGITPICTRVNNTKLGKNDIAVEQGGAGSVRGSIGLSVVVALAAAMFML